MKMIGRLLYRGKILFDVLVNTVVLLSFVVISTHVLQ